MIRAIAFALLLLASPAFGAWGSHQVVSPWVSAPWASDEKDDAMRQWNLRNPTNPTIPGAMRGSMGTPSKSNRFVTEEGIRNLVWIIDHTPTVSAEYGSVAYTGETPKIVIYRLVASETSYTMTWGSLAFKSQGPLVTGTVAGKVFTVTFARTGTAEGPGGTITAWTEISRTGAM